MRRGWPVVLVLLVLADDALLRATRPGYAVLGLLDEPAHLATGVLVTAAVAGVVGGLSRSVWVAAALSTVLIDADHLPAALGSQLLTEGTPRPYTHSVTTVVVIAVAALAVRRRPVGAVLAGCAVGVTAHLVRDVGTAPVALWWPLSDSGVSMPYAVYAAVLVAAAAVILAADSRVPRR